MVPGALPYPCAAWGREMGTEGQPVRVGGHQPSLPEVHGSNSLSCSQKSASFLHSRYEESLT